MLESSLARVTTDMLLAAPAALRAEYDLEITTIGGVTVISTPDPEADFWCRAIGFPDPPGAELVEEITEHFRVRGVQRAEFVIPRSDSAEFDAIVGKQGMTLIARVQTFTGRPPLTPPPAALSLRVGRVGPAGHRRCATLMWEAFGRATAPHIALSATALDDPRLEAHACWDGDEMVGIGLAYRDDRVGHLVSGAVRAEYRGRGVQSALIAARVTAAQEAGCDLLVTEAYVGGSSARNVVRAGFVPGYERQTWLWTSGAAIRG